MAAASVTDRPPLIAIYVVTFRRHGMLRRAIASVLAQTYRNIIVKIINDDPADCQVETIGREFNDPRVSLLEPVAKRGATRNFNLAFKEAAADYVSILEDDNWWEPTFLDSQLRALASDPDAPLVVGNELVWQELPDGNWRNTGRTIWPFRDVRTHRYRAEEVAGSARICNSSMLIRVSRAGALLTPETIPVDVTEHFRERLLPPTILLNGEPLVNYAETIRTARSTGSESWGYWQYLLIGSLFIATGSPLARIALARKLWKHCPSATSPRAVSLVATSVAIPEAGSIFWTAPYASLARFAIWLARRPFRLVALRSVGRRHSKELAFLVNARLTQHCALASE